MGLQNMVGLNKVEEVAISSLGSEINDLNSTMDCIFDFELSDDSESDDDFTDSEILQVSVWKIVQNHKGHYNGGFIIEVSS